MLQALRVLHRLCFHDVHVLSIRCLSTSEVYECNLKISALVRAGKIEVARHFFDAMPLKDVVSWNTMIAAYWRRNDYEESKRLFDLMPERNTVSWNCMVSGYVEKGDMQLASRYFQEMPDRNIASWNTMISGLVKFNRVDEAERLFSEMPRRNVISYTSLINGLASNGNITRARCLFDRMQMKNAISWAVMISGYVENGMLEEARNLFTLMPDKNTMAITAMITGCCKEGKIKDAEKLFSEMREKDLVSWNAMISGYANNLRGSEALQLYVHMLRLGIQPDCTTLLVVLTACSVLASLLCGKQIHATAVKMRLEYDHSLCNSFITMYSKCGDINDADLIFRKIQSAPLTSWNTIIAAFAQHGRYHKSCTMFHDLIANGLSPDGITFLSILSACGHAGMVNESLIWFKVMVFEFRIRPRTEHFSCLVDIMSRSGQLERACEVINKMPFQAEGAVWSALLGACRAYLNVELAELAARKLVQLDSHSSGAYVMLSNIYAASGMWRDVTKVRRLMKERGVQKQPGHSWLEMGNSVHVFVGGDVAHPEIQRIHSELDSIYRHMTTRIVDDIIT